MRSTEFWVLPAAAVLGLGLLWVYWATMPPDITFEDTALFAGACRTLGLPHPPGYPLHTLTCAPFALLANVLPISPGQAAALNSAVTASAACVVTMLLLLRLTGSLPAAALAAGLLGLTPGYWAQATIPEVYGLNALLQAATLYVAQRYVSCGRSRWLYMLALCTGLGIANHWPLYVMVYPAVLLWLTPVWKQIVTRRRELLGAVLCGVAGLAPYVHLLVVSPDAFNFDEQYQPADFGAYVSREVYGLGGELLSWKYRLPNALAIALWFIGQYVYLFGVMVLGGIVLMLRQRRWAQTAAVGWGMLSCTFLLALVRPYDTYSELSVTVFSAYPLPAYLYAAIPLAYCWKQVLGRLKLRPSVALGLSCALLIAVAQLRLPIADRSNDTIAKSESLLLLQEIPPNSLLIDRSNDFAFPLRYVRYFDNQREDIEKISENDYFTEIRNDGRLTVSNEARLAAEQRPVAFLNNLQLATLGRVFHGIYYTVLPDAPAGSTRVDITAQTRDYLYSLYETYHNGVRNGFSRLYIDNAIIQLVTVLTEQQLGGYELHSEDQQLLAVLKETAPGQYGFFIALLTYEDSQLSLEKIEEAGRNIMPYLPELPAARQADILHLISTARFVSGQHDSARQLLETALAQFPSAENFRVIIDLLQIYAQQEDFARYESLRREYPALEVGTALIKTDRQCALWRGKPCAILIESAR